MKAQIELKSKLYKEASAEAERAGYSLDEWVEAAIASQLKKSEGAGQLDGGFIIGNRALGAPFADGLGLDTDDFGG